MSEDLSKYVAERREALMSIGSKYGSSTVQDIAAQFANGLESYEGALAGFGYRASYGQRLAARAAQSVELVGKRPEVARSKSELRAQALSSLKEAKKLHKRYYTIYDALVGDLRDALSEDELRPYQTTLTQTRALGVEPRVIKQRMEQLAGALGDDVFKADLAELGMEDAPDKLRAQAAKLIADSDAAQLERGTKAESAEIDILDALIVEDLRRIRKIARQASAELGRPEIAQAFSLDKLN